MNVHRHTGLTRLIMMAVSLPICIFSEKIVVVNPYESIHWSTCGRYKANLHTHTTESDGSLSPSEVIDTYKEKGYSILSLTDHNKNSWPWTRWKREPKLVGIVGISGCEPSRHHHINSFFCDYDGSSGDIEQSLTIIGTKGGIAQVNHPGRYSKPIEWYSRLYKSHHHLLFMEVYNQGDRYSGDRKKWDDLLTETMPGNPVWGTSNDDMHRKEHLGRNWEVVFTDNASLEENHVRNALTQGRFYFCYDKSGTAQNIVDIDSITVSQDTIHLFADCSDNDIHWISEGKEVSQGKKLSLAATSDLGVYVRAVIHGKDGARTLTQPIGLKEGDTKTEKTGYHWQESERRTAIQRNQYGLWEITTTSSQPTAIQVYTPTGRLLQSFRFTGTTPVLLNAESVRYGVCIIKITPTQGAQKSEYHRVLIAG